MNNRILTIDSWKSRGLKGNDKAITAIKKINENDVKDNNAATDNIIELSPQDEASIDDIVKIARELGLPKAATIKYVNTIFIDPSKAPESISATFVKDHLDQIDVKIQNSDGPWPNEDDFLEIAKEMKESHPKDWMAFKLDSAKLQKNEKSILYFSDASKITDTYFQLLKNKGGKILYENAKWLANIIK